MSLFTGAAILGAALATTGGAVAAAKMNSGAAQTAAGDQAAAAQAALDFTKAQKAKQEAAAAPYLSLGQMAVGNLPGAVRPTPTGGAPTPYGVAPGSLPQGQQTGYSTPSITAPAPAYGNGASFASMGAGGGATATGGTAAPGVASGGGMVTLQAPDGSTRQVPSSSAAALLQKYPILKQVG